MLIAQGVPRPFTLDWFDLHEWGLGVTLVIALVLTVLSRRWVARYRRRAKGGDDAEGRRRRRVATVVGLISGIVVVIAWFVFILTLLKALGVDVTPIIASAGIAGIALGFGAQTIVRDALSGLFIFLEGQYDVGDTVDLTTSAGTVSGTIETLTVRTTSVRQYDGSLSTVPNGVVEIANNRTRGWGRAVVDVPVALDEDPDHVRQVLEELLAEIRGEEPFDTWLRQPPQVLGVAQLTDVAQVIRIAAETVPSHRIDTERLLRAKVLTRMSEREIKSPPITVGLPQPPA
ncbi:MAG: mechanosensitive ion channel family protein [Actinomycetota bacterium]|nr:mechanosensitive ion channel family protein [Actinomycetota bacterium]